MNNTQNTLAQNEKPQEKEQYFSLKLFITVLLAFCAAILFRPSAGILAMTPLPLIIVFFASFVKIGLGYRVFCFGVTVFAFNSTQHGNVYLAGICAALTAGACILFHFGIKAFEKKHTWGLLTFGFSAFLCTVLCFFVMGNPFSALKAKDIVDSYTSITYPAEVNGTPTQYEISPIRYDASGKFYFVDIRNLKSPTDQSTLAVCGTYLCDNFAPILEFNLMEPSRMELTDILRSAFPDENFKISQTGIGGFPKNCAVQEGTTALKERMSFEIHLGGVQLTSEFEEKAKKFLDRIDESGFVYSRITFTAGNSFWYRLACDVESSHFSKRALLTPALRFTGSDDGMLRYPPLDS